MKLILRGDVEGVGRIGDVVDVAPGYARNYLLPKGLAMKSTPGAEAQAESMRRTRALRNAEEKSEAEEIATRLAPTVITVSARADGDRLFGSVSNADIAEAIEAQTGISVDRKRLVLDEHIKTTGLHTVMAELHAEVSVPVQVDVVAD